jgi:uncharacterized protein (TIGR00369 family)
MVGFNAELGFRLAEWTDGRAVIEMPVRPPHLNRSGILHGGVLFTLLDAACGFVGVWTPPGEPIRRALTLSFSANFLGQARDGVVRATAIRKGGGRRVFFATGEVHGPDGTLLAMGEGSYRLRGDG